MQSIRTHLDETRVFVYCCESPVTRFTQVGGGVGISVGTGVDAGVGVGTGVDAGVGVAARLGI